MGLLAVSDFANSDGIKSALEIRWPMSSTLCPESDDWPIGFANKKKGISL